MGSVVPAVVDPSNSQGGLTEPLCPSPLQFLSLSLELRSDQVLPKVVQGEDGGGRRKSDVGVARPSPVTSLCRDMSPNQHGPGVRVSRSTSDEG
eukprot:2184952-Rhodomonas_salina.1